jgi:nitrite reductase (NADH) small subunit
MAEKKRLKKIATLDHLKKSNALSVDIDQGLSIALFLINGQVYALDNHCPHKMALLAEGTLDKHTIICPWHCWKFDITSGRCTSGQDAYVKTYRVTIENNNVYVEL